MGTERPIERDVTDIRRAVEASGLHGSYKDARARAWNLWFRWSTPSRLSVEAELVGSSVPRLVTFVVDVEERTDVETSHEVADRLDAIPFAMTVGELRRSLNDPLLEDDVPVVVLPTDVPEYRPSQGVHTIDAEWFAAMPSRLFVWDPESKNEEATRLRRRVLVVR